MYDIYDKAARDSWWITEKCRWSFIVYCIGAWMWSMWMMWFRIRRERVGDGSLKQEDLEAVEVRDVKNEKGGF